jgi:predicted acetyltransferase
MAARMTLAGQADTSGPAGEGRVHASYWWITEDGTCLGAITLRHELNGFLLRAGGHIGYGIRPSARGRGLATWALPSVLVRTPALGLRKVLVTCGDSNLAKQQRARELLQTDARSESPGGDAWGCGAEWPVPWC